MTNTPKLEGNEKHPISMSLTKTRNGTFIFGDQKPVQLGFLFANMAQFELFEVSAMFFEPGFEKVHFF